LSKARTTVGRDGSADIQVEDNGLSRQHFEILWDGKRGGVRDLGSTNGTKVNGRAITEIGVEADSVISAGRTEFVFKVIAKAVSNE
jgi:pSer/pThr/pTyr-binding forkhead associated (FHA) protein